METNIATKSALMITTAMTGGIIFMIIGIILTIILWEKIKEMYGNW